MDSNRVVCVEETIDLRELLKTILNYKKFIITFTILITLLVGIYLFFIAKPIYESKALIEIGSYKELTYDYKNNSYKLEKIYLDRANNLKAKLEVVFIESRKYDKNKIKWVESIRTLKGSDSFLKVSSYGLTQDLATKELMELLDYAKKEHTNLLNSIKDKRVKKIELIKKEIESIKSSDIKQILQRINKTKQEIEFYKSNLKELAKQLDEIKSSNSTLASIILIQQKNIQDIVSNLEDKLIDLNLQKDKLLIKIDAKKQEILNLQDLLKPYNYKNTHIVDKILKSDKPVKPKKILILIVTLISSLILSIFIIFFREWLKEEVK